MFGRRSKSSEPEQPPADPAEVYTSLRNQILTLDPVEAGLEQPLWGCLMELGYPTGTATLVCLADGTTSLYTTSGSGIIGGGAHETVRRENHNLLVIMDAYLQSMVPSEDVSLPREGQTIFRALTTAGRGIFEASEEDLGERRSEFSPVFYAAQEVITQLRLIDEAAR